MSTWFVGFENETLDAAPELGATITCPTCGAEHAVRDSDPPMLQFYRCGDKTYLAGIKGKDITGRKADVAGKVDL